MIISKNDSVYHPSHYEGSCSIECWDIMDLLSDVISDTEKKYSGKDWHYLLTSFKYIWRYKNKNEAEDVRKADNYLKKASKSARETYFGEWLRHQIYVAKEYYDILEVEDCFKSVDPEE